MSSVPLARTFAVGDRRGALLRLIEGKIHLPALTTAHSHAFQRAMRGKAQRPGASDDDFWSWREAMYELAGSLEPETIYQFSRVAYEELRRNGVNTVGEFHYVHHQADGTPYDDRTCLSDAVITAARDEGLRICLLRVIYNRAGADQRPQGVQRRFSDDSLDHALRDVEELRQRYENRDDVQIGVAPHSVRAVPPEWLATIAAFAERRKMPLHMHVAEQPAEIEACKAETGKRPVELLAEHGVLGERFVAVHATHLSEGEAKMLGDSRSYVCLCPTTERDLGDGLPNVQAMFDAGAQLCVGVDSHVLTSPLEDVRAVELGERLRSGRRVVLRPDQGTPAEMLWRIGSRNGALACGFVDDGEDIQIDRAAPELSLVADENLLDAIVFSGQSRIFDS
jgi:formimidoylglutamate deiminase